MNTHLLYFPYINVPQTAWTYRSLLYYDTISAIVPSSYHGGRSYEPFMKRLIDHHLVIPINPMDKLDRPWELSEFILSFVVHENYKLDESRAFFQRMRSSPDYIQQRISREKFNNGLLDGLERMGLAYPMENDFYEVEPFLAKFMMLSLTNVLSNKLGLFPVTDIEYPKRVMFSTKYGEALSMEHTNRRHQLLEGILPGPEFIELGKLIDFKVKYQKELYHFRLIVEQIATDPKYNNPEQLELKVAELNFHKDEILSRMLENKFGKIANATIKIAGATLALRSPSGWLNYGPTVNTAINDIQGRSDNHPDPSGMKYLALVYKDL